jgi:predicted Zn-dependent peptidase
LDASQIHIGAEVVPGVDVARVEADLVRHLTDLAQSPAPLEEVLRARQIARADWVFDHEKVQQQALSAGFALALFDLPYLERRLEGMFAAGPERLEELAAKYLDPGRSAVLGWSLREGA